MEQDSLIINTTVTTGGQLNLPKPVLQTIPETPREHLSQPKVVKEKVIKIYKAAPEDSLFFNLIVPSTEQISYLKNNVVWDYLHPVKLSNQEWIVSYIESSNVGVTDRNVEIQTGDDNQNIQQDSLTQDSVYKEEVHFDDTVKVVLDSDQEEVALLKADSLETTISEKRDVVQKGDHFIVGQNKDVVSGLLILSVAILGFLRMTNYKYLRELFSAVIYSQEARKMQKSINLRNQMHSYVLNILFLFNTSLFIYEGLKFYDIQTFLAQKLVLIPLLMGVVLVFGLLKTGLYHFIGFVFEKEELTKEYIYYNNLHSKIFGLVILPFILVIPYIDLEVVPVLFKIGIGIFILLYLMQIFRGSTIILKNPYSFFYMFLYLCALEILPLIIIYKLIIN